MEKEFEVEKIAEHVQKDQKKLDNWINFFGLLNIQSKKINLRY